MENRLWNRRINYCVTKGCYGLTANLPPAVPGRPAPLQRRLGPPVGDEKPHSTMVFIGIQLPEEEFGRRLRG